MNLSENNDIRSARDSAETAARTSDWYGPWGEEIKTLLKYVASTDATIRESKEFHQRIWDDNPISATGQGNVSVEKAIDSHTFRKWFSEQSFVALPTMRDARTAVLRELYDQTLVRLEEFADRTPRLKVLRALAALFPTDFTSISYGRKLRALHNAMGLPPGAGAVARHANVLAKLEDALGPPDSGLDGLVARMRLPWLLFTQFVENEPEEATETTSARPGTETLKPLPAARRRRGLTGVSGGIASILNILEFAKDGAAPEDLKDHIRTQSPQLKESSINTSLNVLIAEYNLLRRDGDVYRLTTRGETFLESADPDDIADWILTRIVGTDHLLLWLREEHRIDAAVLVKRLQQVNPGWTTTFAPNVLLNVLRQLDLVDRSEGKYQLTPLGERWASRIDWTPESLPARTEDRDEQAITPPDSIDATDQKNTQVQLAAIDTIRQRLSTGGYFPPSLIAQLHHGLWAHPRRHFAVLTGLSGSGKTQLALQYGRAAAAGNSHDNVRVIPVQPGWHDPSPLLGYVNPLRSEVYVRTDFLEFFVEAASNPGTPYTVVLDEMNLSRPEQYLAPLLSAMETGAAIVLHREGDVLDGMAATIPYPSNLAIIGTVNMDETTHGLSDKVLDRAFAIEFWDIDLSKYPKWNSRNLRAEDEQRARVVLEGLMRSLQPARLHFGWRTVDYVLDFLAAANSSQMPLSESLDSVIYAKVLPKLRGDDSVKFREALEGCIQVLDINELTQSRRRVEELRHDLATTGSARFWR